MLFFITAFMGLIYLYVAFRCLNGMISPVWIKLSVLTLLLPGVLNIVLVLTWGAKMPQWVISFFSWAGLALIYLGMGTFVLDLIRLVYKPITGLNDVIVLVCILLSSFAIYNAYRLPRVHEITIHSEDLPKNWHPLKMVHLTDLHIGQGFGKERLEKIIQKTNDLHPDVIFITGDSVDKSVPVLRDDMRVLEKLNAPTYMVFGNHEYYHGPDEWRKAFEKMGIPVLTNQAIVLDNKDQKYVVGGADFGGWIQKNQISQKLDETFLGTDETLPRLLLVHYPIVFNEAVKKNVLLQLSGHTHGGMTPPISWATTLFNGGYIRGLYQKGKSFLYVSDGTGLWSGMTARLGSFNEIVVIHWVR